MPELRKPLIIVPVRDRRQRRRILTIRNCAITMLSIAIVLASIAIYSARGQKRADEYGRLFGTQAGKPNHDLTRNVSVVEEGSVTDQASTDPMLVAPAVREQLLMAPSNEVRTTTSSTSFTTAPAVVAPSRGTANGHGTTIVGDGSGVVVAHAPASSTASPHVLSGGIFKQQ
ncbi:MAG: hypothetical protein QOK37_3028 [Thermoanaerobaculia bacterium]|jgi:hypothetical protein|nr:hypothetical protein [Thermoanaerobaculia bacterium]